MWQNVNDLVSPKERDDKPIVEVTSPYPIIDMSKVNKRFMSNLPEPERFPVLGCSPDPAFYEPKLVRQYGSTGMSRPLLKSKHDEKYPFGIDFGFDTNLGIVAWYNREGTVHGYI